jgi:hypothetical protein
VLQARDRAVATGGSNAPDRVAVVAETRVGVMVITHHVHAGGHVAKNANSTVAGRRRAPTLAAGPGPTSGVKRAQEQRA